MNLLFSTGIEIETSEAVACDILQPLIPTGWTAGYDGSAGLEVTSPKLTNFDVMATELNRVCSAMRRQGCYIHNKCGLHVHIGFREDIVDLSAKYRLFRFAKAYEALLLRAHAPHDERAHFCRALPQTAWDCVMNGQGFSFWEASIGHDRYWWLNGAAMFKYGTVEFRLANGTLDHNEIIDWVCLLQAMFNSVVNCYTKIDWNRPASTSTKQQLIDDLHLEHPNVAGEIAEGALRWINSKL